MQVFVPYPDIKRSVEVLDPSRLGNQIYRECLTLARGKWPNHPVSKMWWNHTHFLCEYAMAGLDELGYRGKHYPDMFDKFFDIKRSCKDTGPPIWWGDDRVHRSHRSNLLRKDPHHYSQYFDDVPPNLDYFYPEFNQKEVLLHAKQYAP